MKIWYCVSSISGREEDARFFLETNVSDPRVRFILPLRAVFNRNGKEFTRKEYPLYPGYFFFTIEEPVTEDHTGLLSTLVDLCRLNSNVLKILITYRNIRPLTRIDIRTIEELVNPQNVVDISRGYYENGRVRVAEGPLKGKEGFIRKVEVRKRRVKVELEFLGEKRLLDFGFEFIAVAPDKG